MDEQTANHVELVESAMRAVHRLPPLDGDPSASGFADREALEPTAALLQAARAIVEYVLTAARRAGANDANLQFAFPLGELWARERSGAGEMLSRSLITVQAFARTTETQYLRGDPERVQALQEIARMLRVAAAGAAELDGPPRDAFDDAPWYPHLLEGDRWGDVLGYQAPTSAARARVLWRAVHLLRLSLEAADIVFPDAAPAVPSTPLLPTPSTALQAYDRLDLGAAWGVQLDRTSTTQGGDTVDVWFGTTRALRAGTESEFGSDRSPDLQVGRCSVFVPEAHRRGSSGSTLWQKILRLDFRDDTLKLHRTVLLGDGFEKELGTRLKDVDSTRALLFVHGYSTPFEGAIVCAAQLAVDLEIDGVVAAFSWPSRASRVEYIPDLSQAESAWEKFVEFIDRLRAAGVEQLDIVVHSMGNRVLSWAMERLAGGSARVDRLYLAAADLDPDVFRQRSRFYVEVCDTITSYASTADKALMLSRFLHGVDRVGLLPPITTVGGVETIDVSAVEDSFIGHGYFVSASPVLDDIGADMRGVPPGTRRSLTKIDAPPALPHWRLQRSPA